MFCLFRVTARLAVWSVAIAACNQTSYSRPPGRSDSGPLLIKAPVTQKNPSPEGFTTAAAAAAAPQFFLPKNALTDSQLTSMTRPRACVKVLFFCGSLDFKPPGTASALPCRLPPPSRA